MDADIFDEYLQMGESTSLDYMYQFFRAVIAVFGEYYSRSELLRTQDTVVYQRVYGVRDMIGNIDCMHWEWKNYPFGWQCQFSSHSKRCTVILDAVISQDLWI
jgi:formylglycine-generating enzyme required for sulfatase activity